MALTVDLETGRTAFVESVQGFVDAVDVFDEWALLGVSRCHGWTRLDVVVHVIAGWQEMLGGLVSPVDDAPTVDAASFWPAFEESSDEDPLVALLAQRRRTAAYLRPDAARAQLHDVSEAVLRGAAGCPDRRLLWLGEVFTPGDYLAVWAVENAIHQLDLISDDAVPAGALDLVRATAADLGRWSLTDRLPDLG